MELHLNAQPPYSVAGELDHLRRRIEQAASDCATWRAAGMSEKYLEAYSVLQSLESRLDTLQRRLSALSGTAERPH